MDNDQEHYRDWLKVSGAEVKPLADLRAKMVQEVEELKRNVVTGGVAIGISPTDQVLAKYKRGEITQLIFKLFKNSKTRAVEGTLVPEAPVSLSLVGEYSPKFRWHYHGILKVKDVTVLERFKRRITRVIGRCVFEQIHHYNEYIDYMFKQYKNDPFHYYPWDKKECYIQYIRDAVAR